MNFELLERKCPLQMPVRFWDVANKQEQQRIMNKDILMNIALTGAN
jgi:hypothetical protein